jgi:hypothetical protein
LATEAHVDILVRVGAALYTGLRFRVAVEAPLYELDLALDFVELVVRLRMLALVRASPWIGFRTCSSSTEAVKMRPICVSAPTYVVSVAATDRQAAL